MPSKFNPQHKDENVTVVIRSKNETSSLPSRTLMSIFFYDSLHLSFVAFECSRLVGGNLLSARALSYLPN